MNALIELADVWKSYGATNVLAGVNLKVFDGEFIVVRGKSGAGKTTLLKIIGMLENPDRGEVKLFGKPVNNLSDDEKSRLRLKSIGFIFQFFNLIPSLTVLENIELPLALAGVKKQERTEKARELLNHFGLSQLAERFPESLSGGEKQRIAIIRAIISNPKIILADEPTSSIDDENSKLVIELLKRINEERKVTIMLTTTNLYETLPATIEYILKNGQLSKI
ncbi:ABC transporter ATP-binding protein [Candidatus Bathyarchaeota archaeon]|nr:ABC transporter ATP-binding protein [Candidatus Bathyarchaeota archaeon]